MVTVAKKKSGISIKPTSPVSITVTPAVPAVVNTIASINVLRVRHNLLNKMVLLDLELTDGYGNNSQSQLQLTAAQSATFLTSVATAGETLQSLLQSAISAAVSSEYSLINPTITIT